MDLSHWHCRGCGWRGTETSISDASEAKRDPFTGEVFIDRVHIAVCPRCYETVRRVDSQVSR